MSNHFNVFLELPSAKALEADYFIDRLLKKLAIFFLFSINFIFKWVNSKLRSILKF